MTPRWRYGYSSTRLANSVAPLSFQCRMWCAGTAANTAIPGSSAKAGHTTHAGRNRARTAVLGRPRGRDLDASAENARVDIALRSVSATRPQL
ncbi:hypothetical protein A4G27_10275 [Mycobacterium kansasii]|nr:hypothetical protein A4G27_10275 [Mycobacterium kansasii]